MVPVKYSTPITTANSVRRIRSVEPMFAFIVRRFREQRCIATEGPFGEDHHQEQRCRLIDLPSLIQ